MTVADDLATLRRTLIAAREFLNRLPLNDGSSKRAIDREFIAMNLIPEGLMGVDRVEAEITRLGREREAAAVENASLRAALEHHEPSVWAERMVGRMADADLRERAEAAEAEAARLRDGLRPFVEDYDFHAADYLADDSDARVFTARTVESLIADQRKARALLAEDGAA